MVLVKIASTLWLVRQADATAVMDSQRGRIIYYASKLSAVLFVAAMLARACVQRAPSGYVAFWAALLVVAVVMVVAVVRQRIAGTWYGYAHAIKQRRRQRHGP